MEVNGAALCKRLGELKSARTPHENVWRGCYDLSFPLRGDGFQGTQLDAQQAQSKKAQLLDGTSTDASRTLASAIMSGLTPANALWFELDAGEETQEERVWLDNSAETVWLNIHQANFDAEGYESCIDVVAAGWFVLFTDEDRQNGGYSFQQWATSGCYVASTRADGVIDTIFREHTMSAAAAVREFGEKNLSESLRKKAAQKPDDQVTFLHAIFPRTPHVVGARMAKNLPFASVKLEVDTKHVVQESGFHEFPCMVPRWMRIPRSCYGVGPMFDAMPDVRQLNELKYMETAAADVAIAGMWIAEDDGVLNPRTVKVGPRKIIVANSVDSMKELKTSANFTLSFEMTDRLQASIRRVMMADQLQPQDGPAMTATEVHVRMQLVRQLLGPVYGRLQAEYLRPLVERCFGIALRAGILGTPPESLMGRDFSVRYVSPLARSQRLEEVTSVERAVSSLGAFAQAKQDPSMFDWLDEEKAIRTTFDGLGVSDIMRDPKVVAKLRDERAKAMQEQQEQAAAMQTGQVAAEAAVKQAAAA